jgi:hypothetical protein
VISVENKECVIGRSSSPRHMLKPSSIEIKPDSIYGIGECEAIAIDID